MEPARLLEKLLPKPQRDLGGYAAARALEALLEALLALEFLELGYTRNAAGKAFQAWRALTATLLALEKDKIASKLGEKEVRWLEERGIPRVPSSRLKSLSRLIEEVGYEGFSAYTAIALDLHDYQYHGPDPDVELSKYRSREEAAYDVVYLALRLARIVGEKVRPVLERLGLLTEEHGEALEKLKARLEGLGAKT